MPEQIIALLAFAIILFGIIYIMFFRYKAKPHDATTRYRANYPASRRYAKFDSTFREWEAREQEELEKPHEEHKPK